MYLAIGYLAANGKKPLAEDLQRQYEKETGTQSITAQTALSLITRTGLTFKDYLDLKRYFINGCMIFYLHRFINEKSMRESILGVDPENSERYLKMVPMER